MMGVIYSIVAGMAMSFQGVMNTRLSESLGTLKATTLVQFIALSLSALVLLLCGDFNFSALSQTNKLYLSGGALALVITWTVIMGIKALGPAVSISIILISQLLVAALIEALGLLGTAKCDFCWTKFAGLALMIGGILLFKYRS